MSTPGKLWTLLALTAVAGFLAAAAPAGAGQPCWQPVINDWADNQRVDRRYPIHCYQNALKNLPEDMRAYSSAPDDIERAMREEMRRLQGDAEVNETGGAPVTTTGGGSSGSPEPVKPPAEQEDEPLPYLGDSDADQRAESDGVLVQALDEIGPNDASSFPLPLLVLGGLFALLVVAGGVGYLARRRHPPPSDRSGLNAPR